MLAAPAQIDRWWLIIGLQWAEKVMELFQDGGQIKREKDIYHHSPRQISILYYLPDTPSFSLEITVPLSEWTYLDEW